MGDLVKAVEAAKQTTGWVALFSALAAMAVKIHELEERIDQNEKNDADLKEKMISIVNDLPLTDDAVLVKLSDDLKSLLVTEKLAPEPEPATATESAAETV